MIGFESDRDPVPEKTELANWISPGSVQSYDPARQKCAFRLLEQYSHTSTYSNLPHGVRLRLEECKFDREMKIEIASAKTHDANRFIDYIAQMGIDLALSHGKSTAPAGEDGITYEVIRYLNSNICNGVNPIELLFTAIYRGCMKTFFNIPKKDNR